MLTCILLILCLRVAYLTYQSWRQVQATNLRCNASDNFFGWVDDHEHQCIPCSAQGSLLLQRFIYYYHRHNHMNRWGSDQELVQLLDHLLHTHTCPPKRKRRLPKPRRRAQLDDGVYAILTSC